MPAKSATKLQKNEKVATTQEKAFQPKKAEQPNPEEKSRIHILSPGITCDTDPRGHATPQGRSPLELVIDATEGFIPLWARNTTLRWRISERSLINFANPAATRTEIRKLFAEALLAWDTATPVKFTENEDLWDFEIVLNTADQCSLSGCTLARAFFPDTGRHQLNVYPKMFTQSREEQVKTFIHELGHTFGLRHFFANISETTWPSEIFGTHSKFSIMNYGADSKLTPEDKNDLRQLYQLAWSGALTHINGTPIQLVQPYHTLAPTPENTVAIGNKQTRLQPQLRPVYLVGM